MTRKNTPYDAGDHKSVKSAKQLSKVLQNKLRNGFLKIAHDEEARFVLATFLSLSNTFSSTYNSNPYDHAHNAGWRDAGNWWLAQILLHDPSIIAKLQSDDGSPLKVSDDGHNDDPDSDDTVV